MPADGELDEPGAPVLVSLPGMGNVQVLVPPGAREGDWVAFAGNLVLSRRTGAAPCAHQIFNSTSM